MGRRALVGAIIAVGCQGRTEVLFGVVTDLTAPDKIDNVTLIVSRAGTGMVELTTNWMISGNPDQVFNLPGSFGVTSDGGDIGIEADLIGTLGGNVVVERTALLTFVDGQTLFYRMGLTASCARRDGIQRACGNAMTCIEGVCRPQQADSSQFPTFDASLVDNLTCNSGTAYIDTDTGQPMTFSADAGGLSVEPCAAKGTCYNPPSGNHSAPADGGLKSGDGGGSSSTGCQVNFRLPRAGPDLSARTTSACADRRTGLQASPRAARTPSRSAAARRTRVRRLSRLGRSRSSWTAWEGADYIIGDGFDGTCNCQLQTTSCQAQSQCNYNAPGGKATGEITSSGGSGSGPWVFMPELGSGTSSCNAMCTLTVTP